MMIVTKKHLSRRAMLRGIGGAAISLPLLDSMIPALTAQTKTAANVVPRLGCIYVPHGAVMDKWTPVGTGADFEFSPVLSALTRHRENVIVLSNLCHHMAEALGDGGADHSRATATWLNGTHAKKTEGEDVRAGTTIDQMAAAKIGQSTRFPSLELATEDMTGLIGACDVGYSCAYMNTISWSNPTTPLPMEINPRVVFERLFGEGGTVPERLARMDEDKSILDQITGSVPRLQKGLGAKDRTRMNEYLENIREIERRLQIAEKSAGSQVAMPNAPVGVPDSYEEHVGLMFDMMALAFQSDATRVFTFMMARELSQRSYPQVGVPDPHHATSHHQDNPEKLAKLVKIQNYHLDAFREIPRQAESHAGRRRQSARSHHPGVRKLLEQQQYPQSQSASGAARGRRRGYAEGRASPEISGKYADVESLAHHVEQGRRSRRQGRRQHRRPTDV